MLTHVVLAQGLLDQQEVEVVEPRQVRGINERVGGVGVHLQRDVGVSLAHRAHRLDVPAGLNLELDALVALVEVPRDRVE